MRESDGIARTLPLFINYRDDLYPHLALKVALKYLAKNEKINDSEFFINKSGDLVLGTRKIPLVFDGTTILNWYGESGLYNKSTFKYIPFWQVEQTMYGIEQMVPKNYFANKIVYIGTSATSLFDLKSVPTGRIFPGVEIHTTFINNLLDNNFIKRVPFKVDIAVTFLLSLFIGLLLFRIKSTAVSSFITVLTAVLYIIVSTLLMQYFNLWIGVILQLISMAIVFTAVYIVKFILKSRDFEYTYALATTDGLTELYNHRYFQEQMILNAETAKRYNSEFSLILIDIDFFKKFNDNYGHQAGDAVLKQVAQLLKKNVRSTDIVCRYGGEEMAIILSNTNNEEAVTTAQKICELVAQKPFRLSNDLEKNVTISLGVATYPKNGTTPQEMIKYSDKCLYKAKKDGRNRVGCL
jgi:diguanylate cyclase (GGDEF)-like protein